MKKNNFLDISLIMPVWNVSSVIEKVLKSIKRQKYPIREIIVIDNHSSDNSVDIVKKFMRRNKKIRIQLVERKKTYGVSSSYNLGAKLAKAKYIISLHSDSVLPTSKEIEKLIKPFESDDKTVASYPFVVHPRKIWLTYNFWQKCQFAPVVEKERQSMNGKFDCYDRSVFLKIGGYNEKRFGADLGSEDADMHFKLKKYGKVVAAKARVIHLHNLNKNFSLSNLLFSRRFLAIAYGAQLRYHWKEMKLDIVYFLIKPFLGLSVILSVLSPLFLLPMIIFPFLYMRKMFSDVQSLIDLRIFILPVVVIFLIYYETYWMIYGLAFKKKEN